MGGFPEQNFSFRTKRKGARFDANAWSQSGSIASPAIRGASRWEESPLLQNRPVDPNLPRLIGDPNQGRFWKKNSPIICYILPMGCWIISNL